MRRRSTETLARLYLRAHKAAKLLETLKSELLARMTDESRAAVEVAGVGAVVYTPPTSREIVDVEALEAKACELVQRLRSLGEAVDDIVIPKKRSPISACLRVSPPPAPREAPR